MVKSSKPKRAFGPWQAIGLTSAIGVEIAICTVGSFYLGSWLDHQFDSGKLWTIVCFLIGLFGSIFGIVMLIKSLLEETDG
ncbi:AtpZ/AtpI family protein [Paenibacillus sp. 481]|uniref:AtpZ/AtpI family protein n=1 Tax=Paenibacillus sp. 481 TaxID=2835869 RepID=UPI001E60BE3D|nr:AtpZ/AtpI family protein [Paenibacillus sp. 481]UHA75656.1 AtpZ/AtpI family protein [Paenibacillus sp. 481]